jgi:hypothetical protein
MSLARKSDVKSHLSRPVKRHYLSPDSTNQSEKMAAPEGGNGETPICGVDLGQRPSSADGYAPSTDTVQH